MNLKKLFNSNLHRKIIIFFQENPSSIDSPRGIATWIGYSREKTKKALEELAECGILNSISTPSTSGYSFTHNKKIANLIKRLIKEYQDKS